MSAHRRHLIIRKSDGAFWAGLMFGFVGAPEEAQVFDSIKSAYRNAELCEPEPVTVEPADWYLPDSVLKPLECPPC